MSTAPELPVGAVAPVRRHIGTLHAVPDMPDTDGAAAFDDALRRVAPRLLRYAERRIGNTHEAEEVVQEALLRACQHEAGFATEDDLMAWSTVVTGRLVIDRLRVRGRSVTVAEVPEHARTGRDTADVVVARDEARAALDALEAMPARQASVLWAREVEGLSYDDIADRYGLSEPTVRSLLHRARRTLRREYAARGGTLPVAGVLVALAPWRTPLHGLARLHHVAKQSFAPATLTATTLSFTLGVLAVTVPTPGALGAPAIAEKHAVSQKHIAKAPALRHATTAAIARTATTATTASRPQHPTAAPLAPVDAPRNLTRGVVNNTHVCTPGGKNAYRVGINCVPYQNTPVLVVDVPLPNNPTDIKHLGFTSSKVDCTKLPAIPLTSCVTQQKHRRTR